MQRRETDPGPLSAAEVLDVGAHRLRLWARRRWPWLLALAAVGLTAPAHRERTEVQGRTGETSPEARPARALRARADDARRGQRFDEALRLYRALASSASARDGDRLHARAWSARMRLERGEPSALLDVEGLIDAGMDPATTARFVLALRRLRRREGFAIEARTLDALASRCMTALSIRARTADENGARAARWLSKLTSGDR